MSKIFLIFFVVFFSAEAQVIVNTQYGPIRGAQKISQLNTTYLSFQRIPYMRPPENYFRFRDPVPPQNWTETLDCTQEGPRFPQIDFTWEPPFAPFRGELDSMHINVFTKNLNPTSKYPVMVWIHGGGFRTGSGLSEIYGPDYLMERDVILVTFNYRLQVFGFASFDDPDLGIPGNAGFKDQVMALRWVKENIENFGGDSQNITIFGQSSGGGCAHYHIISPASKDLFQRSIIISGSAFNPAYAAIPRRNWAFRIATMIGYGGPEVDRQILEFLEVADPQELFSAAGNLLTPYERNVERLINAFGPVIEPYDNGNAFMLAHPEELAKNAWGNDIDIMIGAASFENGRLLPFLMMDTSIGAAFMDFTSWVPYPLNKTEQERQIYGEMLKLTYFGNVDPSPLMYESLIVLSNDFAFWHVIDRVVQQRLRDNSQGRNWVFRFDANDDNNCFRAWTNFPETFHPYRRAIHMDELCFLFKTSFATIPEYGSQSFDLWQRTLDVFTRFAASGNPGIESWISSSNSTLTLSGYNIRENTNLSSFGILPEMSRMKVWREIYEPFVDEPQTDGIGKINCSRFLILTLMIFIISLK